MMNTRYNFQFIIHFSDVIDQGWPIRYHQPHTQASFPGEISLEQRLEYKQKRT